MAGFIIPLLSTLASGVLTGAGIAGGLAAGAVGATGGFAAAGARLAQTAVDVSSGVIGAGTGLIKGAGKAIGVEADQSTSDEQGAKALPPGVELNKNGVMVKAKGAPGAGQILPGQMDDDGNLKSLDDRLGSMEAPDRSDAGPVQQILDYVKVISANTARTAAGIGMLSTSMQQSNTQSGVDDEKGDMSGEGKAGIISKAFGSVSKTLKAVGSSLGKTAKFMVKGLAIGGLLYFFISKREEIESAIAGIFEYFHNFALEVKNSDDPLKTIFDALKSSLTKLGDKLMTMFEEFYKNQIEPILEKALTKVESFMEELLDAIAQYINDTTGYEFFDVAGDSAIRSNMRKTKQPKTQLSALENKYSPEMLAASESDFAFEAQAKKEGITLDATATPDRRDAYQGVQEILRAMINISRKSGGRVQWNGLPRDLSKEKNQTSKTTPLFDLGLTGSIQAIRDSTPVIDGITYPSWDSLDKNSDMYFGGLEKNLNLPEGVGTQFKAELIEKLAEKSRLANSINFREKLLASGEKIGPNNIDYTDNQPGFFADIRYGGSNERERLFGSGNTIEVDKLTLEKLNNDIKLFELEADYYDSAKNGQSIHTHDHHSERLLEPISKAFANGGGAPVIIDSSSNDNSIKKQGDTMQMAMGVHHSDRTASAFHEWKYA